MNIRLRLPRLSSRLSAWMKNLAPDGRDLHSYGGLALIWWGLRGGPYPWASWIVVGAVLWYMGLFKFGKLPRDKA